MSWRLVEGVPLPDAVGGHPALDFCNTRAGWGDPAPKEYLRTPGVLPLWARENGLVPAVRPEVADDGALGRALALREALYRCALGTGRDADWDLVSGEASAARAASVLRPGGDAGALWAPRGETGTPADALRAVALAAEDLLTSDLSGFVAACPGEGCGWLFADRRRRRRWCSMAACGNRAKARRYAERHGVRV
ncbi:MAG TPA: ABATE domain-containing protein [Kineosporiaceae bacterium]|nr:ABATE domain-containing protein [Kineosporiaceae bacterium]